MTKIVVTGHKGFIGSYIYWKLRSAGFYHVFGIDKKDGHRIGKSGVLPVDCDVVFHCAANLFGQYQENIESTKYLLDKYKDAHFVFLSSAAVYGNTNLAREDDELFPFGDYGRSKEIEENMVRKNRSWNIYRLSNVYGLGTDHGFYHKCLFDKWINIPYPDHIRDYVHVDDVTDFILLEGFIEKNNIYNLSTGVGTRNVDLFRKLRTDDYMKSPEEGQEEIAVSVLSPEKAKSYGFKPRGFRS